MAIRAHTGVVASASGKDATVTPSNTTSYDIKRHVCGRGPAFDLRWFKFENEQHIYVCMMACIKFDAFRAHMEIAFAPDGHHYWRPNGDYGDYTHVDDAVGKFRAGQHHAITDLGTHIASTRYEIVAPINYSLYVRIITRFIPRAKYIDMTAFDAMFKHARDNDGTDIFERTQFNDLHDGWYEYITYASIEDVTIELGYIRAMRTMHARI